MTLLLIVTAIFLLGLGGGVVLWFAFYTRRLAQGEKTALKTGKSERLPFRWSYVMLPAIMLLLAIFLVAFFYQQLPAEVAYHFKFDGSPDKWMGHEMTIVWMIAPQLCLALLAGAIVWGITKSGILSRQTTGDLHPERILSLMGNIIGLPQFIICFAMLDIFNYNSYQTHIMPIWIFALVVVALGGIILGIFFVLTIWRVRGATNSPSE